MSNKTAIFVSVKQQVNDINSALTGLLSELQSLRKTVDSLYAENHSLNRNVDRLLKENRELRKRHNMQCAIWNVAQATIRVCPATSSARQPTANLTSPTTRTRAEHTSTVSLSPFLTVFGTALRRFSTELKQPDLSGKSARTRPAPSVCFSPVEKARVIDPFGHAGFDPSGKTRLTP